MDEYGSPRVYNKHITIMGNVSIKPRIVYIEGNIGSGKTTLLDQLELRGHCVVREPLDQWTLLEKRYDDPKRWAFAFQVQAMITLSDGIKQALQEHNIVFVERSIASALVFSNVAFAEELITYEEFRLLQSVAALLCNRMPAVVSTTAYIECTPDECFTRWKKRNRSGETLTHTYLQKVEDAHRRVSNHWMMLDGMCDPATIADTLIAHVLQ